MTLRNARLLTAGLALGGLIVVTQGCGSSGGAAGGGDSGADVVASHHDSGNVPDSGRPVESGAPTDAHDATTGDAATHDSGRGKDGGSPMRETGAPADGTGVTEGGNEAGHDDASGSEGGHDHDADVDAGHDAGKTMDSGNSGGHHDAATAIDSGDDTGSGSLSTLSFAILGDTRPPTQDDTAGYPTAVISKIWQDIEAASPRPAFAIDTGDYMFSSPSHTPGTQDAQLQDFITARATFTGLLYPAMGNDECDGAMADNCYACGTACTDVGGTCVAGTCTTPNLSAFLSTLLAPVGEGLPYYAVHLTGTGNAWTAKFVFVACNAWSATQATWLSTELATATTYTFVVNHAGTLATTAPCLTGTGSMNAEAIISASPYTLLIGGETDGYAYYADDKEVVVGNGGAPLSGATDYGYVLAQQQADGAIVFTEYDYESNAAQNTFTILP